jgi:hypothetical protein
VLRQVFALVARRKLDSIMRVYCSRLCHILYALAAVYVLCADTVAAILMRKTDSHLLTRTS